MTEPLDIEQPDALLRYLRESQRVRCDETPVFTVLAGGVSNRTVLVRRANGDEWVLKQALPKLRVKEDWFSDPARVHREALGLRWLEQLAPLGAVPRFLFEDKVHHLFAMQAVPQPHENWKMRLLAGGLEQDHVVQFGHLLGTIHRCSREREREIASAFDDRSFFESLRLEPYYRFAAHRNPIATDFLRKLIEETWAARLALTHGDYSPKNILVHRGRLVLLDHEVIHFGDPAFDLGFSLTHLLSKAHHLSTQRAAFLNAAQTCWASYQEAAGDLARHAGLEARAARHTLGCLLARVDGRSPLEYLTGPEQARQRDTVLEMMCAPPARLPQLIDVFGARLGN
ncbi:MAG: phosphotransferase [Verrucomicrobia bacterium]|nr:phosphotransferase [Verrucomicrobiota bacterium]